MFLCKECASRTGWFYKLGQSFGLCELCSRERDCDDIHPRCPANPGSLEQIRKERDERRAGTQFVEPV